MTVQLQKIDMNFVNTASFQFINIVELNATPEKVFQVLCDGNSWCKWFPGMKSVIWTSKEPKKVGTTRTVNVNNIIINEYFLIWEENKRFSFRFDSIEKSSPFKAGLEDYILEEMPNGNTRLTYAVYIEPSFIIGLCSCISKKNISKMFYDASLSFQNHINNNSYEAPCIMSPII